MLVGLEFLRAYDSKKAAIFLEVLKRTLNHSSRSAFDLMTINLEKTGNSRRVRAILMLEVLKCRV